MERRLKNRQKSRPQPTTRANRPAAEINITITLPTKELAHTIYTSLLPETKMPAGYRSQTRIRTIGNMLELKIVASDLVALRAASNTFLRFVSVALKTVSVVAPFYRAGSPD
ncbi:MAG TPA: KEOPS complex subunit Pcc1 [Candidatus Bathyarchaeia archaeon]|nr:KEOPS complex subunit Pcc1 [Candidatus Bathyarchaeia archaeon]